MNHAYHVVDVFTTVPLEGNALAVFPDGRGLDTPTMQRVARELNLSETTFIFPPQMDGAAAKVRIFTPSREMEFAGHPTIGTAYVMRKLSMVSKAATEFIIEENVGPVSIRVDAGEDPILWLKTPAITRGRSYSRPQCARALSVAEEDLLPGIPCELYSAGNPNIFIPLKDATTVDSVRLDSLAFRELVKDRASPTCIFPFTPTLRGAYSRMFAPDLGIIEDPATGSATGPLAAYMMEHGLASGCDGTRFISEQGTKMGRRSILHVLIRGSHGSEAIEIGGNVTPTVIAEISLPVPAAA